MAENENVQRAQPSGGVVQVKFGMYSRNGQFAGKTVKQVREELNKVTQWNLEAGSKAFRGKTELGENDILQEGDSIEYVQRMGEKG